MKVQDMKYIKVLDRGIIPTSRGNCRGPIGPYRENMNRILVLISRGFKVVEVLSDGSEVELTVNNYDKTDNVKPEEPKKEVKPDMTAAQPAETNRQLSRKEKKQKAAEQRKMQEEAKKAEEEKKETEEPKTEVATEETPVADATVPSEAIEA